MARAAIEFTGDIKPFLPQLSQRVEGCAYNSEAHLAAFRKDDMVVVIHPNQISIFKIPDEAKAKEVIAWLKSELEIIGQNLNADAEKR